MPNDTVITEGMNAYTRVYAKCHPYGDLSELRRIPISKMDSGQRACYRELSKQIFFTARPAEPCDGENHAHRRSTR
jgi:hypothetical protein